MAIWGRDQAQHELGELFPSLLKAVSAAVSHLWQDYAADMYRTSPRSRASVLCDWIGDELKKELFGRSGIAFREHYKTTSMAIGHNWYLRPHKVDDSFAVAVNDTQACMALADNKLVEDTIPGTPPSATVIYVGYVENVADPLRPRVFLICPDGAGEEPAWEIELGTASPPEPTEMQPEAETEETRIVPRPDKRRILH